LTAAVLFDLDGTLLDTAPDFLQILNQLLQQENKPALLLSELRHVVAGGSDAMVQYSFNITEEDPQFWKLKQQLLQEYQRIVGTHVRPFEGINTVLQHLNTANIPWGIVTNKHAHFTKLLLDKLKMNAQFVHKPGCIVSGDTTPFCKPHPAPLLYACKLLKVNPTECIFVGDAERDVVAGKACGMKTIVAHFGYIRFDEDIATWGADFCVDRPEAILDYI